MRIDFNELDSIHERNYFDGSGDIYFKSIESTRGIVSELHIPPGSSIGLHDHGQGDVIVYVISGEGEAVCDGAIEPLYPGVCHICKIGSHHTIMNTGGKDLVLFDVEVAV